MKDSVRPGRGSHLRPKPPAARLGGRGLVDQHAGQGADDDRNDEEHDAPAPPEPPALSTRRPFGVSHVPDLSSMWWRGPRRIAVRRHWTLVALATPERPSHDRTARPRPAGSTVRTR